MEGVSPGSDLCSLLPADVYWACFGHPPSSGNPEVQVQPCPTELTHFSLAQKHLLKWTHDTQSSLAAGFRASLDLSPISWHAQDFCGR